jgi:hypothetical protein
MPRKNKRRQSPGIKRNVNYSELNAIENYEELRQKALASRVEQVLKGKMAPSRNQIVDKLNRRRKDGGLL